MQYFVFAFLAPIAATVILVTLVYAWQRWNTPGAQALVWYLSMVAGFLFTNTLQLLDPSEAGSLFWARFSYLFVTLIPVTWLAYALQYAGRTYWLSPGRFWVFFVIPLLTFLFVLTNEQHGLVWQSFAFHHVEGFLALKVSYGLWFWVHQLYSYGMLLSGAVIIGREYFFSHRIYRQQSMWVIAGAVIPLAFNLIYVFRLIPGLEKDYSPIVFALSGLAFSLGIFKYRLLNLAPVARSTLVDTMPDAMLILDRYYRVVDLNPAARRFLDQREDTDLIGQPLSELWPGASNWVQDLSTAPETVFIERYGRRWAYSLRVSELAIRDTGQRGWLLVLSDITRRVEMDEALERANQALAATNAALRQVNEELEERIAARTEALRQRAQELEALSRVSSSLRKASGLEELLNILLAETAAVSEAAVGAVLLLEEEELVVSARYNLDVLPGLRHSPCGDRLWQAVETGQSLYLQASTIDLERESELFRRLVNGHSDISITLFRTATRILGVLYLAFDRPPAISWEELSRLLTAISEMAGNALQRVRTMENLEALVQSRTRDLSTLYQVTSATNQPFELPDLLQRVLGTVLEVLGPRAGLIHLQGEEKPLFLAAHAGLDEVALRCLPEPEAPDSPWQRVLATENILVLPDLPSPVRCDGSDLVACVCVPIRVKGSLVGVLSVLDVTIGHFSAEDIALLAAIADQVGGVVERSRLRQRAEQAAVMEERQRLARDLHDSVSQSLYSLLLFAEAAGDALQAGGIEKATSYLDRLTETAQQALKEMRLLIYELRPLSLQTEGLAGALRRRLETVERRAGIDARLEVESLAPLSERAEIGLYGIAQEALNNVLKHARATQVTVRITAGHGCVELQVIDNGQGFSVDLAQASGGIGLSSMRERARALGGTLDIVSTAGHGTRIHAIIHQEESI